MKKKYLGFFGALAMAGSLAACGSSGGPMNLGELVAALFDDVAMVGAAGGPCGGAACNGVLADTYGVDADTTALVDFLFTAGTSPSVSDMILCATGTVPGGWDTDLDCTTFALDVPAGQEQVVSLSVTQTIDCGGASDGTITVVDTITGTLDDAEAVVASTDAGSSSTQTIRAVNCKITGDVLAGDFGGSPATTIVINGSVTSVEHSGKTPLAAADPDTFRVTGNFTVTTDLDGAPPATDTFWTDRINFNASGYDNGTPADARIDGGMCFGSAVDLGGAGANDNTTDADDDCATVTDQFVPSSDLP